MPRHLIDVNIFLAAFAISGRLRLVTFDRALRQFEETGLDLEVLDPSDL